MTLLKPSRVLAAGALLLAFAASAFADTLPVLSVSRSGANLQLSWPATAADWMPCAASDIAAADWMLVSAVPAVVGGQNVVTLPIASAKGY